MEKLRATSFEEMVARLVSATEGREDRISTAADGLHICPACHSRLVQPIWWDEASDDSLRVALSCPNCEWSAVERFEHRLVDELELELDRGDAELEVDLALLTHANMVDEIDRFVRALDADAIQPFDF
jgi:hypothetical protein